MDEAEIKALLKKRWLHAIIAFEVAGKPKQHVEDSLTKYIENLTKDERIKIISEDREEALEHEDGVFSAFSECDMLVQDLETITWLCINFSPASIEILEPDELKIESRDMTNWFNDLLANLHDISLKFRTHATANEHLVIAMNQLIRNAITLSLKGGPKTKEELIKQTGVVEIQMDEFLKNLTEKGKITEEAGKYTLV